MATPKRWVLKEFDQAQADLLQAQLGVHPTICQLLVQRDITDYDAAREFFRPSLDQLHDPFLMKDMSEAIERIEQAISNGEKILIYGDYDVDGTTSVALVYSFFSDFYDQLDFYIPDRYKEGYGISIAGIDFAKENDFSLIIALDCGIKAIHQVEHANKLGIDFIICDHHTPGEKLPEAVAVLDPKRINCTYPYKELSGCGIGFKLIQAFAQRNEIPWELVEKQFDLLVISIASDLVPITGENRTLAHFGLKRLNVSPRAGIRSLMQQAELQGKVNISNIVFVIGPRINAAGRMEHGRRAVELLIQQNPESFTEAETLHNHNADRKRVDKDITEEAISMIQNDAILQQRNTTVLYQPGWHKGVIGIVASRLIETYYRPTIVLTQANGLVTGSARSVKGFNVYNAINECSDLLEQFGGHKYAAGLTMTQEAVPQFIERFEEVVTETIDPQLLIPEVEVDAMLELNAIDYKLYNILQQFAPFGPGNMRPVFMSEDVWDTQGYSKVVGERHLKLHITQDGKNSKNGIAFGMGDLGEQISGKRQKPVHFDLTYVLEENEWQGNKSIQMNVRDIKLNQA